MLTVINYAIMIFITEFLCCRFNAYSAKELTKYEPISEEPSVTLNSMRYRGIGGFVAAVSPFNFTAIGGNLAYTPALMVGLSII
jgi:1-pyrroline-5-carboxylate dehydrogenase